MSGRGIRVIPKGQDDALTLTFIKYTGEERRVWGLTAAIAANPKKGTAGVVSYVHYATNTTVSLCHDVLLGFRYFHIEGAAEVMLARRIRGLVEPYNARELLAWWDRAVIEDDVDDKVDAVLFLGTGAPAKPTAPITKRLLTALTDPDKDVRNAAIVGMGYADWPEAFRAALEEVKRADPDKTARKRAKIVLDQWSSERT